MGAFYAPLKRSCDTEESLLQVFQRFEAGCNDATT